MRYFFQRILLLSAFVLCLFKNGFAQTSEPINEAIFYQEELKATDTRDTYITRHNNMTESIRREILRTRHDLEKDQSALAQEIIDRKIKIKRENEFLATEFGKGLELLYQKAVTQFKQKQWEESENNFKQIEELFPNYKKTRDYLKQLKSVQVQDVKVSGE